uniref:Uncharacterized protein n=1 Tax=Streptomyces avermitilis TaxID=33903 RepID=A0A499V9P3_STRAX|nr:hypothetical protein SAVMC3_22090 [Streptomyces avermitilis]
MRAESNGSISRDSVIQPSFGVCSGGAGFAPQVSQGEDETSMVKRFERLGYEV